MPDFTNMDIATLTHSVTGKGVRYLELFLKEYTLLFKGPVNPACTACLKKYLTQYQNHFKAMANTSHYRLHAKYENIPLQFGSPILVNNANITNEYAQILLQRPGGERLFAKMPATGEDGAILDIENPETDSRFPLNIPSLTGTEYEDALEGFDDLPEDHLQS